MNRFFIVISAFCLLIFFRVNFINAKTISFNDLKNFKKIKAGGKIEVLITQGSDYNVRLTADDAIIEFITIEVIGDSLIAQYKKNRIDFFDFFQNAVLEVTLPELDEIKLDGSGHVRSVSKLEVNSLDINIAGSGNINLDVNSNNTFFSCSGSGNAYLTGESKKLSININGSGHFKGYNLITKDSDVKISGSGNCEINVIENLNVIINGSGKVIYTGRPYINQRISGSGDIIMK